jgi:segregation and condensation protein B
MEDLKNIIESLLFVAEEPLTVDKLRAILETVDSKDIRATLQLLADDYAQRKGGFWLREVAGGWQIRSRPEYHEWIKRMLQPSPQRLSRAALETLALIAYKQPVIRADIEHIRGVDCGGVLRQLMERKLIRVLGRREIAGRPLIYATTKLFLEMFDLKNLNDLPTPLEIAELGNTLRSPTDAGPPPAPQDPTTDGRMIETDAQSEKNQTPEPESTDNIPETGELESTPEIDDLPSHEETTRMDLPEDKAETAVTHEDGHVVPQSNQEQASGEVLSESPGDDEPPDPKNA